MSQTIEERAVAYIAQYWAATVARWVALLLGLCAAYWHGFPAIATGGLAFWFLGMAIPPPCPDLDRATREQ